MGGVPQDLEVCISAFMSVMCISSSFISEKEVFLQIWEKGLCVYTQVPGPLLDCFYQ